MNFPAISQSYDITISLDILCALCVSVVNCCGFSLAKFLKWRMSMATLKGGAYGNQKYPNDQ
jgi:hypothetical protein